MFSAFILFYCTYQVVACPELQDQPYSADLSLVAENRHVHPITKSSCCWLVHPSGAARERPALPSEHHSMELCRELEPYISLIADLEQTENNVGADQKELVDKAEDDLTDTSKVCSSVNHVRQQPVVFDNPAYYYLYNRLVDFLTSRDIVCQQINQVVQACQPGEVVIRDALCQLGVAQINTEKQDDDESGLNLQTQEGGTETYEVSLSE